ncbi:MAG: hypothetical protein ACI4SF_12855 [Oscillospiraceae bacterium]
MPELDYTSDRMCPVFKREIDCDLCYESIMALSKAVKVSSVPELSEIENIEEARIICDKCPYSDLS